MSESTAGPTSELAAELETSGLGPTTMAAVGSIALALYYYYVRGEKERGQFVGHWPATILALAIYLELDQIKRLLQQGED